MKRRKVLKLSRDFELLTIKDEKRGASDAGHNANTLEDLPAQQFSLGSCMGSSTPLGTSRAQRRRKPTAELIRRKGGMPQTPPAAGPSTTVISVFRSSPASHLTSLPALPPTTPASMYTFTATAHSLRRPPY
ncbi:hypothetical protein PVAP13_8NG221501 [Panicum virgatum]|uniref:Uncharacterized protein n=2 Tax=Panicum virgatum TaxID=38727 RepID=A0A8T0PCD8_PANVG|nr:hypothetical protein PVAP13_8NG221501 [Panicum virgatum]